MKKKRNIYVYYAIMLMVLASRISFTGEPPMVLRLFFLAAVILPTIVNKEVSYPAVITMFYTLTINGFSYSYMPYTFTLYVLITLVLVFFTSISNDKKVGTVPILLWVFGLYVFFIDLFSFASSNFSSQPGAVWIQDTFYCFVLLGCFILMSKKDVNNMSQLSLSFAVTSIVLSLAYLTHMEEFVRSEIEGMERSGWTDSNYFGMVMGMGTVIGLTKILGSGWRELSLGEKITYILAVVFSLPALGFVASRGAMLSVVVSSVVLFVFSKRKISQKIIIVLVASVFIVYLYNNNYFSILEYRFLNDDGTGSGRTEIWLSKLSAFAQGNPIKLIFGHGHVGGANISGIHIGFHNDFIGCLVDYGLIGLFFLLYVLYYPIKITPKEAQERTSVLAIIVFLIISFLTLEPFLTGIIGYFTYYMYALFLAQNSKQKPSIV